MRKTWLGLPLIAGIVVVGAAAPAFAKGGKLPVGSGITLPVAYGRQIQNMRADEIECQRASPGSPNANALIFQAEIALYKSSVTQLQAELTAAANTLVIPTIGFYCPKAGGPVNVTPGVAYVPVHHGNQVDNLRHDAVTCVITGLPVERDAVVTDYNVQSFIPGGFQDEFAAESNPVIVPPIHDLCPAAP